MVITETHAVRQLTTIIIIIISSKINVKQE